MKIFSISLAIVIIDQVLKLLVKGINIPLFGKIGGVGYFNSINLIDGFLKITYLENYGIAFGLEFGERFRFVVIILTILVIILLTIYSYLIRNKVFKIRLGIGFIIAGAFGNLIDRTFYSFIFEENGRLFQGKVIDFIQIKMFEFSLFGKTIDSLPVFNIADLSVFIGTIMLLLFSWKNSHPDE